MTPAQRKFDIERKMRLERKIIKLEDDELADGLKAQTVRASDLDWEDPFSDKSAPELAPNQIESDGKILTLNDGQFIALTAGRDFLKGDTGFQFACIAGSAGSGKTTIAKAVLEGTYSVVVTAPTHKAKKVVSRATGYKGETIQKILGMRPDTSLEDFKQDNILFSLTGKSLLDQYRVVLIDEASMLNGTMVKLLKEKAIEHDIKIIFLGDPRQLPPVKEQISRVFVDEDIMQIRLTKVERQQVGNPLILLYDKILTHIDNIDHLNLKLKDATLSDAKRYLIQQQMDEIPYEFKSNLNEEGLGYKFVENKSEFGELIMAGFKVGEDLDNKVLAWSNDSVAAYNASIRKRLLGEKDLPVQEGEFIMAYNSVTDVNDWRHILYENSADYIVRKVVKGYRPAANFDKTIKADIQGFFVTIEDLDNDRGSEKIFVVARESYNDWIKIEQCYAKFAQEMKTNKKWAWKQYFDFRNQFAIFSDIRASYSGVVKDPKKVKIDFDFGYAITIHKSQGSTYNNIFMVDDFYNNPLAAERWRLGYVGLSRPRKCAYILNSIAR